MAGEPCASLDLQAGKVVMALFISLARRVGVTVLFTSHDVQHALHFGDRVLGLKGGRMVIDAAAAAVSSSEIGRLYA